MKTSAGFAPLGVLFAFTFALSAQPGYAEPQQFGSPAEAAKALVQAVESPTTESLVAIFGDDAKELLTSGDPIQDKNDMDRFRQRVKDMTAVSKTAETTATLIVGKEAWPFPIPLVKSDDKWSFDIPAGRQTILDRRIGENELNAIKAAKAYVEAQFQYASQDHDGDGVYEYAQKFVSSPGERDGLYWPAEDGEEESPLGEFFAAATAEGYEIPEGGKSGAPRPEGFHGYHYKILTGQGDKAPGGSYSYVNNGNMITDFALIATPVKYGETGIMTFLVNSRGEVFQKPVKGTELETFNPDANWEMVD